MMIDMLCDACVRGECGRFNSNNGVCSDVSTLDPEIEVRVFKKYAVGDVKEVGEFYINLRPFENKPPIELWQLVENKPENCKAEILFGIHYVKKAVSVITCIL